MDSSGKPLSFAAIAVARDSALRFKLPSELFINSAEKRESVQIDSLEPGQYFLRARSIGYVAGIVSATVSPGTNSVRIVLRRFTEVGYAVVIDDTERTGADGQLPPRPDTVNLDSLHNANDRRWFSVVVTEFNHANIINYPIMIRNTWEKAWGPLYQRERGYVIVEQPRLGPTLVEAICPGRVGRPVVAGTTMTIVTPRMQENVRVWVDPNICESASPIPRRNAR